MPRRLCDPTTIFLVKHSLDSLVDPYRHNLYPGTAPQGCILGRSRLA